MSPKLSISHRARAAARVQHPNVVPVLNAGMQGNFCFLVQRYIAGETLKDRIVAQKWLPHGVVLRMLKDVCAGLASVHQHGIVHRDVKPSNIILAYMGTSMLADFGFARPADEGDISNQWDIVGTPYYMSPEQCDARPLDGRSDLYSLGATAYHALTGCMPIPGDTALAVLCGHLERVPLPPTKVRPEIPAELSNIVMKLLAKTPGGRYHTGKELSEALEHVTLRTDPAAAC